MPAAITLAAMTLAVVVYLAVVAYLAALAVSLVVVPASSAVALAAYPAAAAETESEVEAVLEAAANLRPSEWHALENEAAAQWGRCPAWKFSFDFQS